LNCSSCGKPLGAVAHIYDDKLFCEDCWIKIGAPQGANSPAHTVLIGQHNDDDRARAAQTVPNENISTVSLPPGSSPATSPTPIPMAHPSLFLPGEHVIWKRTFSKGIIHRHPTVIEAITNKRILVVDEELRAIVRAVPVSTTTMVVTNTKREYSSVRSGYGQRGVYSSVGGGSSVTYGDIEFVSQGNVVFVLRRIRDPFGVKNLLAAAFKS
jgi:hypothetical protein